MSTLIMSTGAFCTETAIDYPSSYLNINDSYLYPIDFDSNLKENQLSKSLEEHSIEKNTEQASIDCMNNQSSSNLLSSEFMTSSYYQLTTESTALSHTSISESSSSTVSNTMSTTVSSLSDQGWLPTMDAYNAPMMQQQHAGSANTPHIDSALNVNVSEMTSMDYLSSNMIEQMPRGDLPGYSQIQPRVSSLDGSQDLSFLSSPSDNFITVKDAPENSFNELLLPSISETAATASSTTVFNNPSTPRSLSGSFFSQSSELQLSSPLQQSAGNMASSTQAFAAEILPAGSGSRKMKASVSARHRHTVSQSSGEFNRAKQYRHHSYPEGRRRSNITPPSPLVHQELYKQPIQALSFEDSAHSWPCFGSETSLPSPQSYKKNVSYGPTMTCVKQEFNSQDSISAATSDKDYISTFQGQQSFHRFSDMRTTSVEPKQDCMIDSPASLPTTCTYSHVSDHAFNSPHQSPIRSIGSPHSIDYVIKSVDNMKFKKSSLNQQQISEGFDLQGNFSQHMENIYESQSATSSRNINQYFPERTTTFQIKSQSNDLKHLSSSTYSDQMFVQRPTNYNTNDLTTFATPTPPSFPTFKDVIEKKSSFATPSPLRPSSEGLCAVCGDNAACQHYGVRTCEGCKGFFKRTVQKKSTYVCLANKNCPVDKRRRNRCQFCRFQKCLAVGMVKEVVRTANLKGRRGRLPSKPKGPKDPVAPPSPPVSFITSLVRAHIDTNPAITNTDLSQYRTSGMPPSSSMRTADEESQYFFELLASCLLVVRQWAEKIPGFCSLQQEDQTTLIESSFLEIFALRLAYRLEIQEGKFVFCNGIALHRDQLYSSFGDWTDNLMSFACTLSDLNVDISSFSCMLALTLFQDRAGIRERQKVEEMRRLILATLKEHAGKSLVTADRPNFFMKLLSTTPDLAAVASAGARRLYQQTIDSPAVSLPQCLQRGMNTFLNV